MVTRRATATLAISLGLFLTAAPADAGHETLAAYSSPSGKVYTQIFRDTGTGQIKLQLVTFVHRGRYNLCVKPDGGSVDCDRYRLRSGFDGLKQSTVDWRSNYPASGAKQTVSWRKKGRQIGPSLKFNPGS